MRTRPIFIVKKTDGNGRQVQYLGFVIGEYEDLEEAKQFAKDYKYGVYIDIRSGEDMIERIMK